MNCEAKNTTKLSRETKNLIKRIALGLFVGYLLTFLLFYVANYLSDSLALAYVWLFAQKLTYLLPLLVTAMVTLALYAVNLCNALRRQRLTQHYAGSNLRHRHICRLREEWYGT